MSLQDGTKPGDLCPMWVSGSHPYSVYWQNAETGLLYFRGGCWSDPVLTQQKADYYNEFFPEKGGTHVVVDDRTMRVVPAGAYFYTYRDGRQKLSASTA